MRDCAIWRFCKKSSKETATSNSISAKNVNKRARRRKNEVARNFKCPHPGCDKAYGSDNSLGQHLKLKHTDDLLDSSSESRKQENKEPTLKSKRFFVDEQDLFFDDNYKEGEKGHWPEFGFESGDLVNE